MHKECEPVWLEGRNINEVAFCREFLEEHQLVYCDGAFFVPEGRLPSEDAVRSMILQEIQNHVTSHLARRVEQLLGALRLMARKDLRDDVALLNFANGTYQIDTGCFTPVKQCCRHRLPVNYNPDAPEPATWLSFLSQLLEPEDIPTLQEYMGYCLVPITIAQRMLMIIGNGGEGKSRIGVVMRSLLGDNMNQGSISKVEQNAFARADLQHKLLMVDDDLRLEALTSTHYLKSIISAELPMDLERKGIQSYQGRLTVRFLAFGNGALRALHDRSYGFFRRQIILNAKPRNPDRVDDPYLGERLVQEREGILLWCIRGLERLWARDFQFTTSPRADGNLADSYLDSNNMVQFMLSEGYFRYDEQGSISSRQLYGLYRDWCEDNACTPFGSSSFWSYLSRNAGDFGLRYSNNIPIGQGRRARGFYGIRSIPGALL